jgi:pyridoxamine 5'-phosphate oxidase
MTDTELRSGDFTEAAEPFRLFASWLEDATKSEPNDPNGLALATVDETGMPDVRMVLLKGFDEEGFVFYTNLESAKGREILSSMRPPCASTGRACVGRCACAGRSRW